MRPKRKSRKVSTNIRRFRIFVFARMSKRYSICKAILRHFTAYIPLVYKYPHTHIQSRTGRYGFITARIQSIVMCCPFCLRRRTSRGSTGKKTRQTQISRFYFSLNLPYPGRVGTKSASTAAQAVVAAAAAMSERKSIFFVFFMRNKNGK